MVCMLTLKQLITLVRIFKILIIMIMSCISVALHQNVDYNVLIKWSEMEFDACLHIKIHIIVKIINNIVNSDLT